MGVYVHTSTYIPTDLRTCMACIHLYTGMHMCVLDISSPTQRRTAKVQRTQIAHEQYPKLLRTLLTQLQIKVTLKVTERFSPGNAQSAL